MITDRKITGRAVSIPVGLAIGATVSIVVTILTSVIGAHLITSEVLPQEQIGYCSIATLLLGTILGAITASGKIKRRKLCVCLLSGLSYYGLLLATTALFFGGQYQGMGVTLITICLGCAAAALISSHEKKTRTHYKRRKTNR